LKTPLQQPVWQMLPAQQGCVGAPQATQSVPSQAKPAAVQTPSAQQGWPAPPQATQLAPSQVVPEAVQTAPVQQAWLSAPQLPHAPAAQVPPMVGHAALTATQVPPTQQPPPAQKSPGQQVSLLAPLPHATQSFIILQ
jgi:hypothetical protein